MRTLLLAASAALLVVTSIKSVQAHDPYSNWRQPFNPQGSCCRDQGSEHKSDSPWTIGLDQEGDCRPTRAYLDDDGVWHAWNGKKWLIVPWQAMLPQDYAHDGRSHLCEKHEQIYCFSPGSPKG